MQNKIKILLAEDNLNDVKILVHTLKEGGLDFILKSVQTSEDFTSHLISLQPDIVISDYSMPQFNGMEALNISKQINPEIPFIIVTGSMNEETAVKCIKAGADDYVIKEHLSAIVPAILSALNKYELLKEKIKLQEELSGREEKYRSIFSVSADGIIIIDKQSRKIIDANKAACALYKYSPDEILELSYDKLLEPSGLNNFDLYDKKNIEINYHKTKDGVLIPVELSYSSYIQNNRSYLVISIRDITEKLLMTEKLKHNNERLEVLFNLSQKKFNFENELIDYALGEIVHLSGSKMGVIHFIKGSEIEYSYIKHSDSNYNTSNFIPGKKYLITETGFWKECLLGKKPLILNSFQNLQTKIFYPGIYSNVKNLLSLPIVENNSTIGIISLCDKNCDYNEDDILQLSLFINAMWKIIQNRRYIEKIKQFSTIIEQSPVSIIITGKNGNIEYVNPKYCETTGYSYNELIGETAQFLNPDFNSSYDYEELWNTILSGKVWSGIYHNTKKNGELFWESIIISAIKNDRDEITHYIALKEDITKKVEAERELDNYKKHLEHMVTERTLKLAQVNKQLEVELEKEKAIEETVKLALVKEKELNELKSKFISTISHEFRTPLATVFSSIELLEMYGQKWDNEKNSKHISRIKESIKYLTNLLDEVISMNRIETGKLKINLEKKDLYELCKVLIEDAKDLSCGRHNIEYKFESDIKEFMIDEKILRYILNNLLSNAVKYTPAKNNIWLTVSVTKNDISFELKDEGLGIPKNDQIHLFEPFFRASNIQNISGSGLGLSIVRNSVELHNGKIYFESEENKGSKFKCIIPRINPSNED